MRADGPLIVASAAGATEHPQRYRNLLTHPLVRRELGTEVLDATAVPAEGERRERLFGAVVQTAPGSGDHQRHTARRLPVVVLERPGTGAPAREAASLADKLLEVHDWLRAQLRQLRTETETHLTGGGGVGTGMGVGVPGTARVPGSSGARTADPASTAWRSART
ncbi:nitroreductase/quinone reductase family protein [Kitasatospora sp. NPDC094019]|uniref:nitroreductase/quinone reductase family protein n=1 Tax=Kitasatospora sp. NPDC094019 TaxID=3364091 RepID=UPI00380CF2EE